MEEGMQSLKGADQLRLATEALQRLYMQKGELNPENFREMCWGLSLIAAGLYNTLMDIHGHVVETPTQPAPKQPPPSILPSR